MKKLICILVVALLLTGCFNYADINWIVFVTSIGIDIDENNKTILYAEAFTGLRGDGGTESEGRIVFRSTGDTIFEAIRNLHLSSSLRLNFTQNKAIIFSEKAAKYGLDNFLDTLIRNEELLVRQFIYVSKMDLEDLLKIKLQEEKYLGIFLAELSRNIPALTKRPQMRIDEFIIARKLGSKINVISLIEEDKDSPVKRIFIRKLAVLKEDKMIDELHLNDIFYYNIATDNLKTGFIKIAHPSDKDKLINLEILKTKTKTHINYDGETITVKKEITMKTDVAYTPKTLHIEIENEEERKKLSEYANKKIKKGCMSLYNKYRYMGIDIFNLKRHIDTKYPNANASEILNSVSLIIEPNIIIEGSPNITDFY